MKLNLRPRQAMLAAAIVIAGSAVGVETAANAAGATGDAPISINDHFVAADYKGSTTARFYHRFTNEGPVTADVVRFTVYPGNGAKPQVITETGTFSPGVGIDREDNLGARTSAMGVGKPSCTVSYVHFTDGTSWAAPSPQ
jgi:hypothetical protein